MAHETAAVPRRQSTVSAAMRGSSFGPRPLISPRAGRRIEERRDDLGGLSRPQLAGVRHLGDAQVAGGRPPVPRAPLPRVPVP